MTHTRLYRGIIPVTAPICRSYATKIVTGASGNVAVIDLPFSAVFNTVLLPCDYSRRDNNTDEESPRSRMLHSH
ncbi:YceK/YidQ family lipoprotein [Sodalis-like endosymbiont of Proechinophthirus fluctus]|uniref:YceK/YidQ family lipoprotein n=1 Tax=Sodalis-like endosymbiont of Proechinophthirus fluctus TaxID=1462730 RepID=UPI0034E9677C